MNTLRYAPDEIRDMILAKNPIIHESWGDLLDEYGLAGGTGGESGQIDLMIEATYFLEVRFPGEKWGWQDFDQLLSECLSGYWESREEIGLIRANEIVYDTEELAKGEVPGQVGPLRLRQATADSMTEAELIEFGLSVPGTHVMKSVRRPGKVVVFDGVRSIADVLR